MKRSEVPWETRFNELVKYEAKHGDCNVPSSQGTLGNWVRVQRKTYIANSLTQDRIDRLNRIDFNWALKGPTVPWETRFNELVQYKAVERTEKPQQLHTQELCKGQRKGQLLTV